MDGLVDYCSCSTLIRGIQGIVIPRGGNMLVLNNIFLLIQEHNPTAHLLPRCIGY